MQNMKKKNQKRDSSKKYPGLKEWLIYILYKERLRSILYKKKWPMYIPYIEWPGFISYKEWLMNLENIFK